MDENPIVDVILIGGSSASGKTKFQQALVEKIAESLFTGVIAFSIDCFYLNPPEAAFEDISKYDFDHPDAFDWLFLIKTVDTIKKQLKDTNPGHTISYELPYYDFTTHSRIGSTVHEVLVKPKMVIILEGIFALHNENLLDMAQVKLFIEVDEKTRILRRIIRDLLFRKRNILHIVFQILSQVEPAYEKLVKPTRANASLMINNNITSNEISSLMSNLREMGCTTFDPQEMIRTVAGKQETFAEGSGGHLQDAVGLVAKFVLSF
jgi:uridine kinase